MDTVKKLFKSFAAWKRHAHRPRHHGLRLRAAARLAGELSEGLWPWLENLILPALALGCVHIALMAASNRSIQSPAKQKLGYDSIIRTLHDVASPIRAPGSPEVPQQLQSQLDR